MTPKELRAQARERQREHREELRRQELGLADYVYEAPKKSAPKPRRPKAWELEE